MEDFPHLKTPPVVEAIIEFRIQEGENIEINVLQEIVAQFKSTLPISEERRSGLFRTTFTDGEANTEILNTEVQGYRLKTGDGKRVLQVMQDKLVLSYLPLYVDFDQLKKEALKFWNVYAAHAGIEKIRRIGVRFVNRIEIPMPVSDFSDYLTTAPIIPDKLPQGLANFFSQVVIPKEEIGAAATVIQTMEQPNMEKEIVPVLLDIDAFLLNDVVLNDDEINEILENLRYYKNEIFYQYTTDKALEPYR